jgi:thioredoxin-like negative regulator of GroEL
VYNQLVDKYPQTRFGFVDIRSDEGERIKASFGIDYIPWTFFVQSVDGQRIAYRFNGLESVSRLSKMLDDTTLWQNMNRQMAVPEIVSVFGLYLYYARRDLTQLVYSEAFWDFERH